MGPPPRRRLAGNCQTRSPPPSCRGAVESSGPRARTPDGVPRDHDTCAQRGHDRPELRRLPSPHGEHAAPHGGHATPRERLRVSRPEGIVKAKAQNLYVTKSVKDRTALHVVPHACARAASEPGGMIVEPTSGSDRAHSDSDCDVRSAALALPESALVPRRFTVALAPRWSPLGPHVSGTPRTFHRTCFDSAAVSPRAVSPQSKWLRVSCERRRRGHRSAAQCIGCLRERSTLEFSVSAAWWAVWQPNRPIQPPGNAFPDKQIASQPLSPNRRHVCPTVVLTVIGKADRLITSREIRYDRT